MEMEFDILIFTFLAVDLIAIALLTRARTPQKVLIGVLIFSWLVVFYGSFIEPRLLFINSTHIRLYKEIVGEKLRVVLLSDLHIGSYKKSGFVEKVVAKTLALNPDLVLMAGDFISTSENYARDLAPLKKLRAPLGVYAVPGNHDYVETDRFYGEVLSTLSSIGIRVLVNEGVVLQKDKGSFALLGTDDLWINRPDIAAARKAAFKGRKTTTQLPTILLSHNPDIIWEAQRNNINIVLAGHTHGGQIRLPFIGSVPKIPTQLGNSYDRGLFDVGNTKLFITSGLGETGPRARLFVPPEIALLEINM